MGKAKQFRFGLKSYKKPRSAIERPNLFVAQSLRMEPDHFKGEHSAIYRRAARNHNRLMDWAVGKSTHELIDAIGRLGWEASYQRALRRETSGMVDDFRKRAIGYKRQIAARQKEHGDGGRTKDANSPHRRAKDEATKLWPKALRYGWTAERMTKALRELGYIEKQGTVARWMTRLRRGEII